MDELKHYLNLSEQVNRDEALLAMIREYEETTKRLALLIQEPDYDAAEAIRLTNDSEYLSEQIANHPLYRSYVEAKRALQTVLEQRAQKHIPSCSCGCASCQGACSDCADGEGNASESEEKK